MSKITIRLSVLIALILIAAFSRVIPHMSNFSPMGAMGLFGAAYFSRKWQAFLIPIAGIWISDLFINNVVYARYNPGFTWFYTSFYWQYGAYLLIILVGLILFKKVTPGRILTGALSSSLIFFLVTNFSVWPGNPFYTAHIEAWPVNPLYTKNFTGLINCYIAGLPFLKGTLAGDLFYSFSLFGTFALLKSKVPSLRTGRAMQQTVSAE